MDVLAQCMDQSPICTIQLGHACANQRWAIFKIDLTAIGTLYVKVYASSYTLPYKNDKLSTSSLLALTSDCWWPDLRLGGETVLCSQFISLRARQLGLGCA
jgi:hypothetical protein